MNHITICLFYSQPSVMIACPTFPPFKISFHGSSRTLTGSDFVYLSLSDLPTCLQFDYTSQFVVMM